MSNKRAKVIDLHAHIVSPEAERLVADCPEKKGELDAAVRFMGRESAEVNVCQIKELGPKLTVVAERLAAMDNMGVDVQVISPSPSQYYHWAEVELAGALVRAQNEHIAATCEQYAGRLAGLGAIALQHPESAVRQLRYAVKELGLYGVEVSTWIAGRDLADPAFEAFWAAADELGCIVFVHPWGTSLGERLNQHYLANIVGQPIETTIALSHLIFSGALDRHPGVKIVAAHGGGYLPSYIGRSDHAFAARSDSRKMARKPSEYLKQIYIDSLVYTPEALRHLIAEAGAEQIVVGTDYPFDMGHYDPSGLVHSVPELTQAQREAILGHTAERLLQSVHGKTQ